MYLIDTNVIAELERRTPTLWSWSGWMRRTLRSST